MFIAMNRFRVAKGVQSSFRAGLDVDEASRAHSDRSINIWEVPSWQVLPNGVMTLLSASQRSPI
jgi:hypothetical protein